MCVYSCGVVALTSLRKLKALMKTEKFTCRGVKRCGIEAFVILVKLLALVKIEKFTCMCIFLWRCGVRDPREITSSRENRKINL